MKNTAIIQMSRVKVMLPGTLLLLLPLMALAQEEPSVVSSSIARDVRFTEEPDVGNPQVRFREGH